MKNTAAVISVNNLSYSTPAGRQLQKNLSFGLNAGELLLIRGSNGTGKSTLLKILLGQLEPELGEVDINVKNDRIEYIPQLENTEVHFPLTLMDILDISEVVMDGPRISSLGLLTDTHLSSGWNTSSGGERKRAMLTRSLLREPQLLVFDEPMNHLDEESRKAVILAIHRFLTGSSSNRSRAAVMVCHQGLDVDERSLFRLSELNLDEGSR